MTPSLFDSLLISPLAVPSLAVVLATAVALAFLGAALAGRHRETGVDLFAGWGAAIIAYAVLGVLTTVSLTVVTWGVFAAAALGAVFVWRRDGTWGRVGDGPVVWRVGILLLPLLVMAASMLPSQWDEFSHWIPNALYLHQNDAFPRIDLPKPISQWPAYPYGMPLVTLLASTLNTVFVENAGTIFNVVLLIALAPVALRIIAKGLGAPKGWAASWPVAALGVLSVTVLSATFVQKLVFTGYAETATAALFAVTGFLLWELLNALASSDADGDDARARVRSLSIQLGLCVAAFLFVKQTNSVLLFFLGLGALLVVLRDANVSLLRCLKLTPLVFGPGLMVFVLWQYHADVHMPVGDYSLPPLSEWRLGQTFDVLQRIGSIMMNKGLYFAMVAVVGFLAVAAWMRPMTDRGRFLIIAAAPAVGYILFLWFVYVAVLDEYQGLRAMSFWRHNTQNGLLVMMALAFVAAQEWRRRGTPSLAKVLRGVGGVVAVAVVVAPIAFSEKIRFDQRPQKLHVRHVVDDIAPNWDASEQLIVIDPKGNGLVTELVKYHFLRHGFSTPGTVTNVSNAMAVSPKLRSSLDSMNATAVLVHVPLPAVQKAFGVTMTPQAINLVRRLDGGDWRMVKAWPYPGYETPYGMPD